MKEKKDRRPVLLVLLFVLLFAFVWSIPYINELLDNLRKDAGMSSIERQARQIEEAQNKKNNKNSAVSNKEKKEYAKLVCTSQTTALETYDITTVETFEYDTKNKQVEKSSKKVTYKFNAVNETYENLKTQCNENSLKYVDRKGYEVACSYNDTEVVMEDSFDLETFKTIQSGATMIEANAKYKESIESIKTRLISLGYTCE